MEREWGPKIEAISVFQELTVDINGRLMVYKSDCGNPTVGI